MKNLLIILIVIGMVFTATAAFADKAEKNAEERAEIDKVAKDTLDKILKDAKGAPALYEKAYGYAVFDNLQITFIFTGGGGKGVAVDKSTGARTYMKMGTGGISFGIGAQKLQVIMFFENKDVFTAFIEKGWKAETGAEAAAGTAGASVATTFVNGIAVYQITEAGLMASADISGTKYSKDKDLNKKD
jgi:lipid-binding SYLF domain-containing protein